MESSCWFELEFEWNLMENVGASGFEPGSGWSYAFEMTLPNVPPSLPSPHRHFLWPSLLGQIGSAKQRARNRDVRHSWLGAPTLPRPRVIHKHDGLAVISLHLQHKRREWEEREWKQQRVSVSVRCPLGVVLKWMGKEGDEKKRWSRKGGEGVFLYRPGWASSEAGRKPGTKLHLRSDAPSSSCFTDYTSAEPDVLFWVKIT